MRYFLHILRYTILVCASGFLVFGQDQTPLHYHALVIGINEYEHWGDLRRAQKDAEGVAEVLAGKYDFASVSTLFDEEANAVNIEDTLRRISSELNESDALLIYFSGHGYYDELLDEGFWIPSDGRMSIENQPAVRDWVPNDRIKQYLAKSAARHVLIVSDACFSGSLFKGGFPEVNPTTLSWYRHVIDQPSRWAITSGDMELVPDAGIFGIKLLQLLKFPPREVFSVTDLFSWLRQEVSAFEGTIPLAGPLNEPSHAMGGEFVFVNKGIEAGFWNTIGETNLSIRDTDRGQLQCYANLSSQVYVDDKWVGYVEAGESILIDSLIPGIRSLIVKSDAGVFQKQVSVAPGTLSQVNAIFYTEQESSDFLAPVGSGEAGLLHLRMDKEEDLKQTGFFENNGALVARDAIRGNALRFQQRGYVVYRSAHLDTFGRGDFSVGFWFKWMGRVGEDQVIFSKVDPYRSVGVSIEDGFLVSGIHAPVPEIEGLDRLSSPERIEPGAWYHVVVQREGLNTSLWLNGKLVSSVTHPEQWDFSNSGPLVVGYNAIHYDQHFTGLIDEFELRQFALSDAQVEAAYQLKFEKYRVTRKSYSEREDLDLIVKKLYGGSARLADWEEILSRFGGELDAFWDHLGVGEGERVWLTYLNRRFFNSARHFYALKSAAPEELDEEIHQQAKMEDGSLVLSSWISMELPMLVEL